MDFIFALLGLKIVAVAQSSKSATEEPLPNRPALPWPGFNEFEHQIIANKVVKDVEHVFRSCLLWESLKASAYVLGEHSLAGDLGSEMLWSFLESCHALPVER